MKNPRKIIVGSLFLLLFVGLVWPQDQVIRRGGSSSSSGGQTGSQNLTNWSGTATNEVIRGVTNAGNATYSIINDSNAPTIAFKSFSISGGTLTDEGTNIHVNVTGGSGKVAQIVTATSTTKTSTATVIPFDTSIPQQTGEGAEFLTVTITPTDAASTLVITFDAFVANSNAGGGTAVALFVDATENAIQAKGFVSSGANQLLDCTLRKVVSAASTSARTYKIRYGPGSNTSYMLENGSAAVFGTAAEASLTVVEYLP